MCSELSAVDDHYCNMLKVRAGSKKIQLSVAKKKNQHQKATTGAQKVSTWSSLCCLARSSIIAKKAVLASESIDVGDARVKKRPTKTLKREREREFQSD